MARIRRLASDHWKIVGGACDTRRGATNISQIYEIGEDGGELFIAMERLEGGSLADRLRRAALSVAEAPPIALGI